jgi:hypothetical protein
MSERKRSKTAFDARRAYESLGVPNEHRSRTPHAKSQMPANVFDRVGHCCVCREHGSDGTAHEHAPHTNARATSTRAVSTDARVNLVIFAPYCAARITIVIRESSIARRRARKFRRADDFFL